MVIDRPDSYPDLDAEVQARRVIHEQMQDEDLLLVHTKPPAAALMHTKSRKHSLLILLPNLYAAVCAFPVLPFNVCVCVCLGERANEIFHIRYGCERKQKYLQPSFPATLILQQNGWICEEFLQWCGTCSRIRCRCP